MLTLVRIDPTRGGYDRDAVQLGAGGIGTRPVPQPAGAAALANRVRAGVFRSVLPSLFVLAVLSVQAQSPESPRAVVRGATAAVEGDSVARFRARMQSAAATPQGDRLARLGLGTLDYLTYDFSGAEAELAGLLGADRSATDPVAVRAKLGMAQVARARADFTDAETLLSDARDDAERLGDEEAATEALLLLAMTRSRTRGPDAAQALFDEASPRVAGDPYLAALYQCGRADLLVLTNRPARASAELGATLARRAGAGRIQAACIAAGASDRAREGDVEGAIAGMRESAELRRRLHDLQGLAVSLQWTGYWLRSVGRLEQARSALDEAVAAGGLAKAGSPRAWAYANLAFIDLAVGDAVAGELEADSAAALLAEQGDRYGEGTLAGIRADVAFGSDDLDAAEAAYERSLRILEPLQFAMGVVGDRIGLAHVALARRRWDEADRQLELAREVAEAGGLEDRVYGLAYHRGVLAMRRGRLADAEVELSAGLRRVEELGDDDDDAAQPEWAYHYRMRLAEIHATRGDLDGAADLAEEAMGALEAWRATLSGPQLRMLAFQISEDRSDPDLGFATIVSALASGGRVERAFHLAERLRERSLRDQDARIESLGEDGAAEASPAERETPSSLTATDVIAAVPDDETALLSWVTGRGGEPTTLFALGRFGIRSLRLPPADSTEREVRRLVAALAAGEIPAALAHEVSEAVLGDVAAEVPAGVRRVIAVPDGPVNLVPFDALPLSDGSSVIDRFDVTVQSSARLAVEAWRSPPREVPPSVLAFGNPDLSRTVDSGLAPLRGAEREARRAARYGRGSAVVLGPGATEARVKAIPPGRYGLIHFATHARLDEGTLRGSVLLLAPGHGEDGVLRPGEIAGLRLDAGLAILSGCATEEGSIVRGEGLVGLASALRQAGVRTVALTRWQVDDDAEAELVERVYRELARGQPVADAVRSAKLAMRAAGSSPAVWASLALVGDADLTVPLRAPRAWTPWAYAAGALLLLLAAVAARPRNSPGRGLRGPVNAGPR